MVVLADRIDTSALSGYLGFHELRIEDPKQRRWDLLYLDSDASGTTDTVQVPLLLGGSPTALAKGDWTVMVVDFVVLAPGMSGTEFVLEEMQRLQVTYARAKAVVHKFQ